MLPVTTGDRETARQIVWYTVAAGRGDARAGRVRVVRPRRTAIAALVLGAVFAWYALELRRTLERVAAVRLFHYSLLYLALLFVAMALDPSSDDRPDPEHDRELATRENEPRSRARTWSGAGRSSALFCVLFGGTVGVAFVYLWLD